MKGPSGAVEALCDASMVVCAVFPDTSLPDSGETSLVVSHSELTASIASGEGGLEASAVEDAGLVALVAAVDEVGVEEEGPDLFPRQRPWAGLVQLVLWTVLRPTDAGAEQRDRSGELYRGRKVEDRRRRVGGWTSRTAVPPEPKPSEEAMLPTRVVAL